MPPLPCATLWHWHPSEVDDSLTSLQWLLDFSLGASSVSVPEALSPLAGPTPVVLPTPPPAACSQARQSLPVVETHGHCPGAVDTGAHHEKPTQSCSSLIFTAIQGSEGGKVTLSAIYEWFQVNFPYYRYTDRPTWKDTIRHTLSVNKGFVKLPKQRGETRKGGFWTVDPKHVDRFRCEVDKVQINLPSRSQQQLPGNCEDVTGAEQKLPSQAVGGRKRKRPQASATSQAKVPCPSSCQLLRADEQRELKLDDFDMDGLLKWASSVEASAGSGLEPLSDLSHTLPPPVQHQLSELCTVDFSAVSAPPPPPPSCDVDWLPQSQCTMLPLDDLVNGFDRDAFPDAAWSEERSQDSREPLSSVPTEEEQAANFNPMSSLRSFFPGEVLDLDSGEVLSLFF